MENGKEAIKAFCTERQYSKRVIDGGLDYLIPRWEGITLEVASGYEFTFDEYLNDMDCRKIISKVWSFASDEQVESYNKRLEIADKRFIENTLPVELCVWGKRKEKRHDYQPGVDWWYYREPKQTSNKWGGNHFAGKEP
jgi:hypothetical protein